MVTSRSSTLITNPTTETNLAPHSVEAERSVLGSILIDPDQIAMIPFLTSDDFFLVRHGWIWEALTALRKQGDTLDLLTVVDHLETRGRLSEVGGAGYITELLTCTTSSQNVEAHATIVRVAALRRQLIEAAQIVARLAHSDETDISTIMAKAEQAVSQVTHSHTRHRTVSVKALTSENFDRTVDVMRNNTPPITHKTGLIDFDTLTGGLRPGNLVIIASRPSMGKTSELLVMAHHIAQTTDKHHGQPVGFISLEMTAQELTARLLVQESRLKFTDLLDGQIRPDDMDTYTRAVGKVGDLDILINDDAALRIYTNALATARQMVVNDGAVALFVDYLQLMEVPTMQEQRSQAIGMITRAFKALAKELDVPVVMAAQLNRSPEGRSDKRPTLADLRDSGEIEQDADVVGLLYRDAYYDPDTKDGMKAELNIAKNRNGATGTIDLIFIGARMWFENCAKTTVDLDELSKDLGMSTTKPAPAKKRTVKPKDVTIPKVAGRDDPNDDK